MPTQPKTTEVLLVRGWQIHQTLGGAALTFGIDATDDAGRSQIAAQKALLLSEVYCRQLAANLLQMADQLKLGSGSA